MEFKKRLGDLVRKERLRRNLSQISLAEQTQISLRTISDIENHNGNPRLETLCLLASYLNISLDSLIYSEVPASDTVMQQIIQELLPYSNKSKQLALSTLRGLLSGMQEET